MAIDRAAARFLIEARASGVSFERTLTIGRQALAASPLWLARALAANGCIARSRRWQWARTVSRRPYVADGLFAALGTQRLDELDNSDFEGASIVWDLNRPVPAELHRRFDAVVDRGSLEHVFEFPTALRSLMSMVAVGGHLLLMTPADNLAGHGFYQLGPELFYRALSDENGFEIERMLVLEDDHVAGRALGALPYLFDAPGPRYSVADAARLPSSAMTFAGRRPATLMVQARRRSAVEPLVEAPQQSRFSVHWGPPSQDGRRERAAIARSRAQGALAALGFHLVFGGLGRGPAPVRRLLLRRAARRRALGGQPKVLRRID
jgi:hypothetical protein